MVVNDFLNEDVSDLTTRLDAMTSDEVFAAMSLLVGLGEHNSGDWDGILFRITLVEEEIGRRFPGGLQEQ